MSIQAFFDSNTFYLSNLKRNPVPFSCTQTPLQPLDYVVSRRIGPTDAVQTLNWAGACMVQWLKLAACLESLNFKFKTNKIILPRSLLMIQYCV